jgi:excisionase family DNA binding protein
MSAAVAVDSLLVTLTVGQLKQLVRDAAREAVAELLEPADPVLTLEEVAELMKMSAKAVIALVRAEGFPGRKCGGIWRFERIAVRAWLLEKALQPAVHGKKLREKLRSIDGGKS